MLTWSPKFPDEAIHYQLDWNPALADGDTVASATPDGANVSLVGTDGGITTVLATGGVAGTSVVVHFTATTALGETLGEDVSFAINARRP